MNREIQQKVRATLFSAKMPLKFWSYALGHVMHVFNRTPSSAIELKTPYEMLHGRKPEVKYIRRFGCLAYYLNYKTVSKFDERGKAGFLISCNPTGYTIFVPATGTKINTKDVQFVESKVYGDIIKESGEPIGSVSDFLDVKCEYI